MAKVLSSISLDSPASALTLNANDTFSFSGTPTFTGKGGVQAYDFKWEVDNGGGYVTIGSGTGLTTADVNPLVGTTSPSTNTITVTCATAGSYTIRMAGASVSGGAYDVFSPTQTVTVSSGITGTMAAVESGADDFSATGTVSDPGITGTMAAVESGADDFSASGTVPISGSLSVQESGADDFTASGTVAISGSLSVQESGSDDFTATGSVGESISGSLVVQEAGADTFSGSGEVPIAGSLVVVETGSDTFSASSGPPPTNGSMKKKQVSFSSFSLGF